MDKNPEGEEVSDRRVTDEINHQGETTTPADSGQAVVTNFFSPHRRFDMVNQLMRFVKEEKGATAIEYGLLAALIAGVIVGSVSLLGGSMNTT